MGKFWMLVGVLVVVAILILVVMFGSVIAEKLRNRKSGPSEWEVRKRKVGNATQVQIEKRGETPYLIGDPVNIGSVLYDDEVLTLVIAAQDKSDTLNRRLPA